ncbi:MAG: hypothetical protein K6T55_06745 [Syntrophobacterales bacterium]|nr:hypothetical protein [Syntrophobacterales bacterium]
MPGPWESHICPGCACLCDDLDLVEADGGLQAHNVCAWGSAKFLGSKKFHPGQPRRRLTAPFVRRRGRREEVSPEAALAQAAELLARARRPVVFGLTACGSRAQEAALAVARHLRARLEPADLNLMAPYYQALLTAEIHHASLEVLRDEADTVLYWGANPLHSCPRHLTRYTVFARGRFTERGVEDRRLAAVDLHRTELARFCQVFVRVAPGADLELIRAVQGVLSGASRATVTGAVRLAEFLRHGEVGVIFAGRGLAVGAEALARFAALGDLIRVLRPARRFFLLPLASDFNSAGLYHLLLTRLGSPWAPDFGEGDPPVFRSQPVRWEEVDALLVTGADLFWLLPEETRRDLTRRQVPVVAVGPWEDRTVARAAVALPAALEGIEVEEVAYRQDGIPVCLRPVLPPPAPAAHQVLTQLLEISS